MTLRILMTGLAIAALGCGAGPDTSRETVLEDSAGVTIARAPAVDRELDWRLTDPIRLQLPADAGVIAPHGLAVDDGGVIYALDGDAHRVLVFDSGGRLLREFGRRGRGPGELSRPIGLSLRGHGRLQIHDYGRGAILLWDPAGTEVGTEPLPGDFWGPALKWSGAAVYNALAAGKFGDEELWLGVGDGRNRLASLSRGDWKDVPLPSCGGYPIAAGPVFGPELVWDARGPVVVSSSSAEYVVERRRDGLPELVIRREVALPSPDAGAAEREVGEWLERMIPPNSPCRPTVAEVVRGRGTAPRAAAVTGVALDDDGGVWVWRRDASGGRRTDVFAADGRYLGTLPAGTPWPAAVMRDRVLVHEETPDGGYGIVLYRVDRARGR